MTRASIFEGSSTDRPGLAAGLMAGALFMLALQDSIVRLTGSDTTLWQFHFLRSCGNLVLLLVLARVIWGTAPKRPKRFWAVAVRSLLLLSAMMFFFGGVPRLTLAEMGAGLYTYPIFVTILSVVVLREPVGIRRIGAVLAGALGAFLILQPGSAGFDLVKLMPVGAGICYAAMVIVTRRYCRQESPVTLAFGVGIVYVTAAATGMVVLNLFPPGEAAARGAALPGPRLATADRGGGRAGAALLGVERGRQPRPDHGLSERRVELAGADRLLLPDLRHPVWVGVLRRFPGCLHAGRDGADRRGRRLHRLARAAAEPGHTGAPRSLSRNRC